MALSLRRPERRANRKIEKQPLVYVDNAAIPKHGYMWFHLLADSLEELHEFAASLGLNPRSFHRGARHPHYDITAGQRQEAIERGASAVTSRDAVRVGRKSARSPQIELTGWTTFVATNNSMKNRS